MEISEIGLLTAKAESTFGTDPTPTPAANTIAVAGPVSYNVRSTRVPRKILDGGLRDIAGSTTQKVVDLKFRTELRGNRTDGSTPDISAGASGQAIEIDALLKACNLNPTYTPEQSGGSRDGYAIYSPKIYTDEGPGATIYFYTHRKLHKATGCKGTFSIGWEAGKMAYIDWSFSGIYVAVADQTFPTTQVFLDTKPPCFVNASAVFDSFSAVLSKVSFDLGNQIAMREDANAADGVRGFIITGRESKITINPEAVLEATHPYWADFVSDEVASLVVPIGTLTGNKATLTATVQVVDPNYSEENRRRHHNLQCAVVASAISTTLGAELQLKFF